MSVSDEGEEFLRTAVSDGEAGTSFLNHLPTREDRCLMKWDTRKIHARTGV